MPPSLILINPWIHDFAAFDLWSKPLGLLTLAARLRQWGFEIHLLDCLDVHHPALKDHPSHPRRQAYGTGKFFREKVAPPAALRSVARPYSRYGIPPTLLESALRSIQAPTAILVTSLMTYWYPGVQEAIAVARKIHPHVPIILGGVYAQLCPEHALAHADADIVARDKDPEALSGILSSLGISVPGGFSPAPLPYPAFDLLSKVTYVCILTSSGCPYRCRYCASHLLSGAYHRRHPADVLDEIRYWRKRFDVKDFVFYDDALLVSSETHLIPLLEKLQCEPEPLRFHTPNAVHVRGITPKVARLMVRAGFRTIRLGLETADPRLHDKLDNKVAPGEFETAVSHLLAAGFPPPSIGAYILIGLPRQSLSSVHETLELVKRAGCMPYLAEYSPIPRTGLWKEAVAHSAYDLSGEPLFHNNSLLPCWNDAQRKALPQLKRMVVEIRETCRSGS